MYTIDEAVRPILKSTKTLIQMYKREGGLSNPVAIEPAWGSRYVSMLFTPPTDEGRAIKVFHKQEEMIKDALLLSSTHIRTLLEDFDGRANFPIPIYDAKGNLADSASMAEVFNTLGHYRYCMVSGEFVHDIFSKENKLGKYAKLGVKIKTVDLFDAVYKFVSMIRVRDFTGKLRGHLERLKVHSEISDIILAVQNVYSISRLFQERLDSDALIRVLLDDRRTAREEQMLREAEASGLLEVRFTRRMEEPVFSIVDQLASKSIRVSIVINGKKEDFDYRWEELFDRLVGVYGDESLVPHDSLIKRFIELEQLGEALYRTPGQAISRGS